jgi:DNA-directed RNA polymerase sigma subunit (sigma70/sigma32)
MSEKNNPWQSDMTQQEVADAMGITRAAVQDIEKRALRKLRNELRKRGLTLNDFFTYKQKRIPKDDRIN